MEKIYLFISLLIFILGCSGNKNEQVTKASLAPESVLNERWKAIDNMIDSIREGDLILRCGNDYASYTLCDFNQQEKLYSHSGIALMHNNVMYVYSNMAGDLNPDEIMRRDDVDSFLTPVNNVAAGIYRYDISNEELEKLKAIVNDHYKNKLQFDMNFDLATDDKMYCAEMIAKVIEKATDNRIVFSKSIINAGLKEKYLKKLLEKKVIPSAKVADQREYLALDNLYLNPHCREIKKIIFGKPQTPIKFPTPENYQH